VGFEHREDAERFHTELGQRMAEFGLELKAEKTRLVEFGRYAAQERKARGQGKPETFDFLGFTHICGVDRKGRFALKRQTSKKRVRGKLKQVKAELRRRMHQSIPEVGRWLRRVVEGHLNYYAVPGNMDALEGYIRQVEYLWWRTLGRRSQKAKASWERVRRLAERWLPKPRIRHPHPNIRFDARTRGRSPVR
jgi:hypothetical protein